MKSKNPKMPPKLRDALESLLDSSVLEAERYDFPRADPLSRYTSRISKMLRRYGSEGSRTVFGVKRYGPKLYRVETMWKLRRALLAHYQGLEFATIFDFIKHAKPGSSYKLADLRKTLPIHSLAEGRPFEYQADTGAQWLRKFSGSWFILAASPSGFCKPGCGIYGLVTVEYWPDIYAEDSLKVDWLQDHPLSILFHEAAKDQRLI